MPMEAITLGVGKLLAAALVGLAAHFVLFGIAAKLAARTRADIDDRLAAALRAPSRVMFPLLVVLFAVPYLAEIGEEALGALRHTMAIVAIATVTWALCAVVDALADAAMARTAIDVEDNLEARQLYTRMIVLERTLIVLFVAIGVACALMTFPRVREIGASLLVSAGFAGLAIGIAARPVLENLIAGLQLAFTQPIRIDDVVIVEGEWGWIEEITATYVVVRIWDQRRLVVPLARFMSQPFENWTRRSADILGTVTIHADYRVPVQAVRDELKRICEASELWDKRVCNLQVTDATERTVALRALVSASSSGRAWDLRVQVREKLVDFLQREHPDCLPRTRVRLDEGPACAGTAPAPG